MHQNSRWKKFRDWLGLPLGMSLIDCETQQISDFIHTVFGYRLIFLGEPPLYKEIQRSSILFRAWIHPEANKQTDCTPIVSRQDKLPLLPDEMDLIFLAHCLEFNVNPHEVLRETYVALKPEGHLIISGFNPWSIWGLWRYLVRFIKPCAWDAEFISLRRLKDWLALLGYDMVQTKMCFFRPPIESLKWLEKTVWLEKIGRWLFPFFGASYIILAKKRVLTLTPLRVEWKRKRKLIPAGLEPVTRI